MEVPKPESKPQRKDQQRDDWQCEWQVYQRLEIPSSLAVLEAAFCGKKNEQREYVGKFRNYNAGDADKHASENNHQECGAS